MYNWNSQYSCCTGGRARCQCNRYETERIHHPITNDTLYYREPMREPIREYREPIRECYNTSPRRSIAQTIDYVPISIVLMVPRDLVDEATSACNKLLNDPHKWCMDRASRDAGKKSCEKPTKYGAVRVVIPTSFYLNVCNEHGPLLWMFVNSIDIMLGGRLYDIDYLYLIKFENDEDRWNLLPGVSDICDLMSMSNSKVVNVVIQPSILGRTPNLGVSKRRRSDIHVSFPNDVNDSPKYGSLSSPPPRDYSPIIRNKRVKFQESKHGVSIKSDTACKQKRHRKKIDYKPPAIHHSHNKSSTTSSEDSGGDVTSSGDSSTVSSNEGIFSSYTPDEISEDTDDAVESVRNTLKSKAELASYFDDWYENTYKKGKKVGSDSLDFPQQEEEEGEESSYDGDREEQDDDDDSISGHCDGSDGGGSGSDSDSDSSDSDSSDSDSSDSVSSVSLNESKVDVSDTTTKKTSPKSTSNSKAHEYVELECSETSRESSDNEAKQLEEIAMDRIPPIQDHCIWVSVDVDTFKKYIDRRCVDQVVCISQLVILNGIPSMTGREMMQIRKIPITSTRVNACISSIQSKKDGCIGVAKVYTNPSGHRQWSSGGITYINMSDIRTMECIEGSEQCFGKPVASIEPAVSDMKHLAQDDKKSKRIKRQMCHYFKDENVAHDTYMQSLMDKDGWVPLKKILEFNKIKKESIKEEDLAEICKGIDRLEVMFCIYTGHLVRIRPIVNIEEIVDIVKEAEVTDIEDKENSAETKTDKDVKSKTHKDVVLENREPIAID